MSNLLLTRAIHLEPFVSSVKRAGAPADLWLNKFGIPASMQFSRDNILAQRAGWSFAEYAAAREGHLTMGYECAMEAPISMPEGIAGIPINPSHLCLDVLEAFAKKMNRETTSTRMCLMKRNDEFWFLRQPPKEGLLVPWQSELYSTTIFLRVVQLCLGLDWLPAKMRFQTRKDQVIIPEQWSNASITFGDICSGFAIPTKDLVKSLKFKGPASEETSDERLNLACWKDDPARILKRLIFPYVVDHRGVNVCQISDALGVTVRTFQRELAKTGNTFSKLVNEIRFDHALSRLEDPGTRIIDIAIELGYKNSGDFARAFSRRAGVSPREFRTFHRTNSN